MEINNNVSMAHFNSFAVPAYADQLFVLENIGQLEELIPLLGNQHTRLILGSGSNILLRSDFQGLVVINQLTGINILVEDTQSVLVEVRAGENWHQFVCWSLEMGYYGLENLSLIPGTVGASPIQNIGAYGVEIEEYVESLTAVDLQTGESKQMNNQQCQFAYRDSMFKNNVDRYLITSVKFRLPKRFLPKLDYLGIKEKLMALNINPDKPSAKQVSKAICALRRVKLPDPNVIGNAGSFFKNPVVPINDYKLLQADNPGLPMYRLADGRCKIPAAWLIDQCGLKGDRIGDAGVYPEHALVLVNHGNATGQQIWALAIKILNAVQNKFGIELEPEPRIL